MSKYLHIVTCTVDFLLHWKIILVLCTPKYVRSYFVHLCHCKGLKDGRVYDKHFVFEKEHLLTLTPEDFVSYFNLKVFGTTNPDEDVCL